LLSFFLVYHSAKSFIVCRSPEMKELIRMSNCFSFSRLRSIGQRVAD
jgi:hypothetical protein